MRTYTHKTTDDPAGDNSLTLPDVTGTIITSGNFPSVFDSIRTLGVVTLDGTTNVDSKSMRIGATGGSSKVEFRGRIGGRFPLIFDGGLTRGVLGSTGAICFCVCACVYVCACV